MRHPLQYVAQPRIRLLAVGFSGLDQAVDLGAGRGALGCVTCTDPHVRSYSIRPLRYVLTQNRAVGQKRIGEEQGKLLIRH